MIQFAQPSDGAYFQPRPDCIGALKSYAVQELRRRRLRLVRPTTMATPGRGEENHFDCTNCEFDRVLPNLNGGLRAVIVQHLSGPAAGRLKWRNCDILRCRARPPTHRNRAA